jgi:hypothetical protein
VIIPVEIRDRTGRKTLRDVISTAPTRLQRHNRPALYSAASQRTQHLNEALRTQRNQVETPSC